MYPRQLHTSGPSGSRFIQGQNHFIIIKQKIILYAQNHQTSALAVKNLPQCPFNLAVCHAVSDVGNAICPFDSQATQDHLCTAVSEVCQGLSLQVKRTAFGIQPNFQSHVFPNRFHTQEHTHYRCGAHNNKLLL